MKKKERPPNGGEKPDSNNDEVTNSKKVIKSSMSKKELTLQTGSDLVNKTFPDINWTIEGLMPPGLTIMAGPPKQGKSWLALNIAVWVSTGTDVLNQYPTNKGKVLYLAFEDSERRLNDRLRKILDAYELDGEVLENMLLPESLKFSKINQDGLNDIIDIIRAHEDLRVVVIDTFGAAFAVEKEYRGNAFHADYAMIGELQELAQELDVSVLLLHHTRKAKSESTFENILGTVGVIAAPDTLMVFRKMNKKDMLYITGRDIENSEHVLEFNSDTFMWHISAEEVDQLNKERKEVYDCFGGDYDLELKTGDIAARLGKSRSNISKLLSKLVADGLIEKAGYGKYKLFNKEESK